MCRNRMYAHTFYNCDTFPSSQFHRHNSIHVNVFRGLQNEEMSLNNAIMKSKRSVSVISGRRYWNEFAVYYRDWSSPVRQENFICNTLETTNTWFPQLTHHKCVFLSPCFTYFTPVSFLPSLSRNNLTNKQP